MRFAFAVVAAAPYPLIAGQFVSGLAIPILIAVFQILVSAVVLRVIERRATKRGARQAALEIIADAQGALP